MLKALLIVAGVALVWMMFGPPPDGYEEGDDPDEDQESATNAARGRPRA